MNRNNFGSVGLIDMPSARMAPDGDLSISLAGFNRTQRYNFGMQVTPWLEVAFRYSGLQHFDAGYPTYYDRAFAMKMRLWNEGEYLPSVSVGINDLVGTGVYGSEYIVATKQIGPVDLSLGLGWGRLASANTIPNPLGIISSFKNRDITTVHQQGLAGETNLSTFFHGKNSGVFGGAVWHTPFQGLDLIAELSSDAYDQEVAAGNFRPQNRFNFAASYEAMEGMRVGAELLYGSGFGLTLSFDIDPTKSKYAARLEPDMTPVSVRSEEDQRQALFNMMRANSKSEASQQSRLTEALASRRNALVDRLFTAMPDLRDIDIQGQTLVVTVARGNLPSRCQAAASALQASDAGVSAILVRDEAGAQTARCAPALFPASVRSERPATINGVPLMLAATQPMIIDATRSTTSPVSRAAAIRQIRADATAQKLHIQVLTLQGSDAIIYYTNSYYFSEAEAASRLFRILMKDAPPEIEHFRVAGMVANIPQRQFEALRTPLERAYSSDLSHIALNDGSITMSAAPGRDPVLTAGARGSYPRFSWNLSPQVRQSLFDPYRPVAFQLLGIASASVELAPGFSIEGEAEATIYDDFTGRTSNSMLPHVRSDFEQYYSKGRNGIGNLEADYRFKPTPEVTGLIRVGYLESMFAGVGGQLLWRPEGGRWAVGIDVYQAWKRDFDRLFGLQNYHVLTGHASLYYQSPYYDLDFALHVGRYLAGDDGATLQVTRRFSTGVEVGAFATFTNVSATQFGEGSFDKGIIIRIPLGWVAPISSQAEVIEEIRPVQRDGGQRLAADDMLFEETRRTSYGEIQRHLDDLVRP